MLSDQSPAANGNSAFTSPVSFSIENQRPSSPTPRIMKARNAPKRVRVPNCTHITMERVYLGEDAQCFVCGRTPSIGFLYECRQDIDLAYPIRSALDEENARNQPKSELRRELEEIGLSESVIVAAEQGNYTDEQLGKLITLKAELKQAISDTIQGNQINGAASRLAAYVHGPSNTDGAFSSLPVKVSATSGCAFRACHTCRPYFKDRIYISFGAVFSDAFKPVTPLDAAFLPTKSARVMREIGLTVAPSLPTSPKDTSPSTLPISTDFTLASTHTPQSSVLTFKTTQSDMDDLDATRRHRRRFYKLGHRSSGDIAQELLRVPLVARQALKTAIQGIFRPSRESSSSGSNITLPMPRTGTARNIGDDYSMGEFDMGALRRVRRQKERNDLRSGIYAAGFEIMDGLSGSQSQTDYTSFYEEDDNSTESDFTVYSCASEGSEVEVEGGVALTEEAVETHTPDILSDSTQALSLFIEQDEMDLSSIMTQV